MSIHDYASSDAGLEAPRFRLPISSAIAYKFLLSLIFSGSSSPERLLTDLNQCAEELFTSRTVQRYFGVVLYALKADNWAPYISRCQVIGASLLQAASRKVADNDSIRRVHMVHNKR